MKRGAWLAGLVVVVCSVACCATAYLAAYGIIGLRLWSY
jgi:hypothetical protein